MKISLDTPNGTVEVEIPPETETVRVMLIPDDEGGTYIDIDIDATFHVLDVPCCKHLMTTCISSDVSIGEIMTEED